MTCAKVSEAEVLFAAGVRDILIANQVVGQAKIERLMRLVERNTLNMEPPRWACGVLEEGAGEWEVRVAVDALLAKVGVTAAQERVDFAREGAVA